MDSTSDDDLVDVVSVLPELGDSFIDSSAEGVIGQLYVLLVATPQPSRQTLLDAGYPAETVDATLRVLTRRGFLQPSVDGGIRVEPPDTALRDLAHRLERQASMARQAVPDLVRLFYATRQPTPPESDTRVQLLFSLDDIATATAQIVGAGTNRVLAMRAPTQRVLDSVRPASGRPPSETLNEHGEQLATEVIYDSRLFEIDGFAEGLAGLAATEIQRVCPNLPFSATIVDESWAVVDVSFAGRPVPHGLLLHTPHIVDPLRWLVERLWEVAVPIARARPKAGLDRRDEQILSLLAAGASDALIARQAKVSQRTVERRIKAILDMLGAQSRFQAGLLAAQRGWL